MRTATPIFATALALSALVPSLASAANTPSISALTEVRLPEMLHPKDAPESLPGSESIEGLRLTRAHRQDFGTVEGLEGRCLTMGSVAPGAIPSGNSNAMIRVSSSALPLRAERFVGASEGKPELEIVDGWADLTSNGMREVRKTRVQLSPIGSGPAGYTIYGFRSEGKVHVVFPTPQRFVYVDSFGKLGFVACQHARLVLDPNTGSGSIVRIAGMIEFPRSLPKSLASQKAEAARHQTLRGIQATASVSRTKRDREPLLSITAIWSEDEPPMPIIGDALAVPMPVEFNEHGEMGDE
jgi:hypothetical protein